MREDRFTNDEASAAAYEQRRGMADDPDDSPTRMEAERDDADLVWEPDDDDEYPDLDDDVPMRAVVNVETGGAL